jgi:tRNA 2-thiocytidine biosynthesis protein TtcA
VSDDGKHIVIRPLAYCREKDLATYAEARQFPIIPCNLCGSQPNLQRQAVKEMMQHWDKKFPGRLENMFRALQNIVPSHLADPRLYDFATLKPREAPFMGGDIAFDEPAVSESVLPLTPSHST